MNSFSLFRFACAAVSFAAAAVVSHGVCFDLNSLTPTGPTLGNTPNSFLYKYDAPGKDPAKESGAVDTFETVISNDGLTATVSWGADVLVDLEKIFLKAANYYVWWDVSGIDWSLYDCFSVTNSYIAKNTAFNGISHVQVEGSTQRVPDSGATLALLGTSLLVLGVVRRARRVQA